MANMNQELQNTEFRLNRGDAHFAPMALGSQVVRRSFRVFKGVYDFSVQGGAIGAIALYDPVFGKAVPLNIPANFIIWECLIDVITAPTSGGSATIAFNSGQTTADLLAATAIASITGFVAGIPVGTAASAIKVPSTQAQPGSAVTITVATAALTAGKFNVHLTGFLSD